MDREHIHAFRKPTNTGMCRLVAMTMDCIASKQFKVE